jgi:sterol desaturase/sphingolipid hydroxylase (fatty acid hydroxylase superfamily)
LHFLLPPETGAEINHRLLALVGFLSGVPPAQVQDLYNENFSGLQQVSLLGLYALLFLTGLESEIDELMAVGLQATTVAVTGVVLPFALGTLGLYYLFRRRRHDRHQHWHHRQRVRGTGLPQDPGGPDRDRRRGAR